VNNVYYEEWLKAREILKARYRACRTEGFAIPPEWCVWHCFRKVKHTCFFCMEKTRSSCALHKKDDKSLVGYVCQACMVKTKLRSFLIDNEEKKDSNPQQELALR